MAGKSLAISAREIFHRRDLAAQKVGRDPQSVRLLAVSKGQSVDSIRQAMALGLRSFGENYVQEWQAKQAELQSLGLDWHFIGHLQTNKVKNVVGHVGLIHSVDRLGLLQTISRQAAAMSIKQKVLIEVNLANEGSKSGVREGELRDLIDEASRTAGISLAGLMTLPPLSEDPEKNRPFFRRLKTMFDDFRSLVMKEPGHAWSELSMGTSADYMVAIEEGATWFRVGEALFGPREKK